MRRISSKLTRWHKKGFPIFWVLFCGVFVVIAIDGALAGKLPFGVVMIPAGMIAFMFILRWILGISQSLDEVYVSDDIVIVRKNHVEDSFPITNIINVSGEMGNPQRITLTLREPCRFGREIVFLPPHHWWPFCRHPLVEELIRRSRPLPVDG